MTTMFGILAGVRQIAASLDSWSERTLLADIERRGITIAVFANEHGEWLVSIPLVHTVNPIDGSVVALSRVGAENS